MCLAKFNFRGKYAKRKKVHGKIYFLVQSRITLLPSENNAAHKQKFPHPKFLPIVHIYLQGEALEISSTARRE